MTGITNDSNDFLNGVETDENGYPLVVFPYGFTVKEIAGKKVIAPLTKEELARFTRVDVSEIKDNPLCFAHLRGGRIGCYVNGCTKQCHPHDGGGYVICNCA